MNHMNGPNQNIDDVEMGEIVAQIRRGCCVPILGAGANASSTSPAYQGLPLAAQLAKKMFQRLGYARKKQDSLQNLKEKLVFDPQKVERLLVELGRNHPDFAELTDLEKIDLLFAHLGLAAGNEQDLARLSLELDVRLGRPSLNRFLMEAIPDLDYEPSPLLQVLARLPLRLIITTNYDRLMEKALEDENKARREQGKEEIDFKVIIHQFEAGFASRMNEELSAYDGLVLYKIHGSLSDGLPGVGEAVEDTNALDKLIITEDDYIEFLTVISDTERTIPPWVKRQLQHSTLLFFGYSLEDWDFRVIYKSLIESLWRDQQERSYAFQREPQPYWQLFWYGKGISIYEMDHYKFAAELGRYFAEE
jgi:hypothetical protein